MSKIIAVSSQAIRKLNTPQLLKGGLYLTWSASILLLITTISGVQEQRQAIKTLGKDSTPSIVTAQRLKDAFGGMDANVANELLVPPGQNPDAVKGYEERYQKATERLVAAAENITYGDKERKPIESMQLGLGNYIAKVQQARDFHQSGDPNSVLVAYRAAAEIMDKTLLPAADELDEANFAELKRSYSEEKFASGRSLFLIMISGVTLIVVLVGFQVFLSQRMRRTLNPYLLAATAIAFIFLGYTTKAILSSANNLTLAKERAFDSMHALRQARALAYSADADQSRYLLDPTFASKHELAFMEKANRLAKLPDGQTVETITTAVKQDKDVKGFTGLLADELVNIPGDFFPGEQEAALASFSTWENYIAIDQQIRQLKQSGKLQEAIALCVGDKPGQSNWAIDEFKKANQKTFDINQAVFDKAIKQGNDDVTGFEITTPIAVSAIALLTLLGLLPRLKEYSS
ncbi:MAG: hypothetical protein ACYTXC_14255 [Nostoc sp.]